VSEVESRPLVEARGLEKSYTQRAGAWSRRGPAVHALAGVDVTVRAGETLGLVGESGSGKSTLGRVLVRLIEPDAGSVRFDGADLLALRGRDLRRMRRHFQIVFQDPWGSLNPRMRVGTAIGEPLVIHRMVRSRAERRARVVELLEQVGLDAAAAGRYPHEFSGGQRQRIGIARAIACSPRFVVADEPVSALDAPVQAQIVNLLVDLKERMGLAYLFIAHDLRLVEHVADRVAVMYLGRIVERGPARRIYETPLHPYTRALLASTPGLEPGAPTPPALAGDPPSPADPPSGCPFHPRCPIAEDVCSRVEPALEPAASDHEVACHLVRRAGCTPREEVVP
jgi:oligopeptide/dipeptide ABC transporter ATP-binding protein